MAKTLEFGLLNDGKYYFWLQTFLDGTNASDIIPALDEREQYILGIKAGKLLRKIHTVPAPVDAEPLDVWHGNIVKNLICELYDNYANSELNRKVGEYIKNNMNILNNLPQTSVHGDFGLGNLIVMPDGEIAPVDFTNQYCRTYSNPWFEIENFSSAPYTDSYLAGEIYGYFDSTVPNEFWKVYLYNEAYAALRILYYYAQEHEWIERIYKWYNERIEQAVSLIPDWYIKTIHEHAHRI